MSTPKSNSEREHSEREHSEDNAAAAAASPSKSSVPKGWFIIAPSSIAIGICFWEGVLAILGCVPKTLHYSYIQFHHGLF